MRSIPVFISLCEHSNTLFTINVHEDVLLHSATFIIRQLLDDAALGHNKIETKRKKIYSHAALEAANMRMRIFMRIYVIMRIYILGYTFPYFHVVKKMMINHMRMKRN